MKSFGWLGFALLGALFAGLVNVVTKQALKQMDVMLAMTLQAMLALLTLAGMTCIGWRWSEINAAPKWAVGLMAISGVLVGLSWAAGYRALQLSDVNHASPIDKLSLPIAVVLAMLFLKEKPTAINWIGVGLMLVGAFCVTRSAVTKG